MICFSSSWPWQECVLGTRRGLCRGQETQGAGPPQQGSRHRPIPPTAGSGWGSGAGCAWGLGSCLLWEAGGSGASPAHTACSVLGPERGNGLGVALLGARSQETGAGRGPLAPGCLAGIALEALGFAAAALFLSIWLACPFWVNGTDSRGRSAEDPGGAGCSILLCARASPLRA